jgi:DNA gyrase subunit A
LLAKEREKKEVQEGLIKACDVIDLIIEILRGSKTVAQAKDCLINGVTEGIKFKSEQSKKDAAGLMFTERQATAILEMRLHRLIGLEIEALRKQYAETMQNIQTYSDILENRASMAKVIISELKAYKKEYAKERKTVIDNVEEAVIEEKPIEVEPVAVLLDRFAYARVIDMATYERNKDAAEEESKKIIFCNNVDKLAIFTSEGNMHLLKVLDLPFGKFRDKGLPIDNVSKFDSSKEDVLLIEAIPNLKDKKLLFGTKSGMIKLVDGGEFDVSKRTTAATKLADKDLVVCVGIVHEGDTVVMQSEEGLFLRIDGITIPEKKKAAVGVRGIRLGAKDSVHAMYILSEGDTKTVKVKGKEVVLNRLHIGNRDTKGVKR